MIVRHEDAHDDARRRRRNDLGVGAHFVARARATTTRGGAGRVIAVAAHESVIAIAARRRARAVEWRDGTATVRHGTGWFAGASRDVAP